MRNLKDIVLERLVLSKNPYTLFPKSKDELIKMINSEIKKELIEKLDEFATYNDSLEEVFENKEQIEVSKYYEKLPKPHALAVEEWLNDKIYFNRQENSNNEVEE